MTPFQWRLSLLVSISVIILHAATVFSTIYVTKELKEGHQPSDTMVDFLYVSSWIFTVVLAVSIFTAMIGLPYAFRIRRTKSDLSIAGLTTNV